MFTAVLAGSCQGGLPRPYLQEETSPPCSKCLRRTEPRSVPRGEVVPHPQPEKHLPSPALEEESHQGMDGASGMCAPYGDQRVLSPASALAQTLPHLPVTITRLRFQGWVLALRSHSWTLDKSPPALYRLVRSLCTSPGSLAPPGLCTGCHQKLHQAPARCPWTSHSLLGTCGPGVSGF